MPVYADIGINWMFPYEVEYEDDDILILRDLGRYHRFDPERTFPARVDKWIDIAGRREYVIIDGRPKLFEILPEKR